MSAITDIWPSVGSVTTELSFISPDGASPVYCASQAGDRTSPPGGFARRSGCKPHRACKHDRIAPSRAVMMRLPMFCARVCRS